MTTLTLSRRTFLRLGGLTALVTATGCSAAGRVLTQTELPEQLEAISPASLANDPVWRFLNRAGYGPRPGDWTTAQELGLEALLEQQLHPEQIDDAAANWLNGRLSLYQMDASRLIEQEISDAIPELMLVTIGRAFYSKRQLYEAMVEFWSDHFNIYLRKNQETPLLKLIDDRDVIRPHALGSFGDLLRASVKSPAMLVYLDNIENHKSHPNENYARELLELHTLGVHGGYTQQDVQELARVLTGWRVARRGLYKGEFYFDPDAHDNGDKRLLGHTIVGGDGEAEVAQALDILLAHPATAVFIATKLVRRFVADEPPASLVQRVAATFTQTGSDIKAMLRVIFLSDEFASAPPKLKRPFTYLISTLRALSADMGRPRALFNWLERMGQAPFHWPPPDGYPDNAAAWASNLLPRWNFALDLLNGRIDGVRLPLERLVASSSATDATAVLNLFAGLTAGRPLSPQETSEFIAYVGSEPLRNQQTRQRLREAVALFIAGPAFQWT